MPAEQELKSFFHRNRTLRLPEGAGVVVPRRIMVRKRFGGASYVVEYEIADENDLPEDVPPPQWVAEPRFREVSTAKYETNRYAISSRASLEDSMSDLVDIAYAAVRDGVPAPPAPPSRSEVASPNTLPSGNQPSPGEMVAALERHRGDLERVAAAFGLGVAAVTVLVEAFGLMSFVRRQRS